MAGGFGRHARGSELPQFIINEREQVHGSLAVALLGGFNELSQIRHGGLVYRPLKGPALQTSTEAEHLLPLATRSVANRSEPRTFA